MDFTTSVHIRTPTALCLQLLMREDGSLHSLPLHTHEPVPLVLSPAKAALLQFGGCVAAAWQEQEHPVLDNLVQPFIEVRDMGPALSP